jgi:UDP-N-acetylmuramoyl-L-alanyl-D-glutamate--2,6-diaminopimelate ligase
MSEGILYVVFAIRGSRGEEINILNSEAVVKGLDGVDHTLIVTCSEEVVDDANTVTSSGKDCCAGNSRETGPNNSTYFKKSYIPALGV